MRDPIELHRLVSYLGEAQARELARLATDPRHAHDVLAQVVKGYTGRYGDQLCARDALDDLHERFEV